MYPKNHRTNFPIATLAVRAAHSTCWSLPSASAEILTVIFYGKNIRAVWRESPTIFILTNSNRLINSKKIFMGYYCFLVFMNFLFCLDYSWVSNLVEFVNLYYLKNHLKILLLRPQQQGLRTRHQFSWLKRKLIKWFLIFDFRFLISDFWKLLKSILLVFFSTKTKISNR